MLTIDHLMLARETEAEFNNGNLEQAEKHLHQFQARVKTAMDFHQQRGHGLVPDDQLVKAAISAIMALTLPDNTDDETLAGQGEMVAAFLIQESERLFMETPEVFSDHGARSASQPDYLSLADLSLVKNIKVRKARGESIHDELNLFNHKVKQAEKIVHEMDGKPINPMDVLVEMTLIIVAMTVGCHNDFSHDQSILVNGLLLQRLRTKRPDVTPPLPDTVSH
ncbi:hypothetical protein [Endozoicomonas sp. SCSIO W0465]|uniref:hypothetical protein n=1 Tax=Endozoicomonas sp. SCSIO W0465 TaxID=2918516 RepID=UPI002075A25E|nr:hypothetical protein [Endozoicomonas sp. SCSIO W0465]USE36907.1 hypothetical protein MJO57_01295 [Endozoicomonas sp. SCSIO W0465]